MGRAATGYVEFRGTPPRWYARVTGHDAAGRTVRPWIDLKRPDLKNTPEDKEIAKRLAAKRAKLASKATFVGKAHARDRPPPPRPAETPETPETREDQIKGAIRGLNKSKAFDMLIDIATSLSRQIVSRDFDVDAGF